MTPDDWLNRTEPFDRIIIYHNKQTTIVDVYPVEDRPLPLRQTPEMKEPLPATVRVVPVGTGEQFDIVRQYIRQVKHWEDLLLEQGEKYLHQGDLSTAFDFYHKVAVRSPYWPGLDKKLQDFLAEEARIRRLRNEHQRALHVLHELRLLNPNYPRAKDDMGLTVDQLIGKAFEDERDYVRARHYLHILEKDYPDHPVARQWRQRFIREAQKVFQQAVQNESQGQARQACLLIQQAAHIWPALPGLKQAFERIFNKYPVLLVGVRELPTRFDPWAPVGSPDDRVARLLYTPLMEVSGVGENTRFTHPVLDGEPSLTELGRRIAMHIKPGLRWSDGVKPITAMDVARALTARCNPNLPGYDAALASALTRVNVPEPYEVVVELKRTQLRPQTNFLFNLAGDIVAQDETDVAARARNNSSGPYRVVASSRNEVRLQANPHYLGGKPQVAEIVERPYPSSREAINALLAGDIAVLEHVHPQQRHRLQDRPEIKLVRSGVPALHVISFDFRRTEFHSRTLRRALAYSIDRKAILEQGILNGSSDSDNHLINGPFPTGTYAYEESIPALPYEPELAAGLASVAKKELGRQTLRFTLHYPDLEEPRQACKFIEVYWEKNLGIQIDLQPWPLQRLEEQIALGRRFDLVYRIHYVTDPVLDAARVLCLGQPITPEGMAMPNCASAWLRQMLRDLELATDWKMARRRLHDLQIRARTDVAIIPLWQLTDYYAYNNKIVTGIEDNRLAFYQDIQRWQAKPWYRQDSEGD